MKPKMIWKLAVDIAMTAALLLLMPYELVGQAAHEWIGIGMFVLFILHHILNGSWSRNILKGRYHPVRILQTGIVFLVLCAMIGSMISGIILSRHALAFLPIKGGRALARNLHMVSAYWGFVLMSVHLGFHWSMIMGMARKFFPRPSAVRKWTGRVLALAIAGYGIYAFVKRDIGDYMILRSHFVFFDYDEPRIFFFLDYIAVMGLFVFIGNYVCAGLRSIDRRQRKTEIGMSQTNGEPEEGNVIYRDFGKTGLKVSAIGMGCEYVWTADEKQIFELMRAAVDAGINYFDLFVGTPTTREYYGKALKGIRDRVYLAGHLGCADKDGQYVKTRDKALCRDFLKQFYEKLDTDYIDVLFLHNCDDEADLNEILDGWMYAYAKELKDKGRVGFIGLSSHSTKIAIEAVKSGKIEVLMFPVNPLFNLLPQDTADARMKGREVKAMTEEEKATYPSKQELYALCGEMGVPIVAMKPFAAGNILKNHEEGRLKGLLSLTPVQCISYVLSFPQVACPVPGFANVDELNQSLAYLEADEEERDFSEI